MVDICTSANFLIIRFLEPNNNNMMCQQLVDHDVQKSNFNHKFASFVDRHPIPFSDQIKCPRKLQFFSRSIYPWFGVGCFQSIMCVYECDFLRVINLNPISKYICCCFFPFGRMWDWDCIWWPPRCEYITWLRTAQAVPIVPAQPPFAALSSDQNIDFFVCFVCYMFIMEEKIYNRNNNKHIVREI